MSSTASFATSHPMIGAGLDTSEGRSFVRERLALEGKTIAILGLGFLAVMFLLHAVLGSVDAPEFGTSRQMLAQLGGSLTMVVLWFVASRRDSSLRTLGAIDAVSLIVACSFWALKTEAVPGGFRIGVLAATIHVVTRAIIVPST